MTYERVYRNLEVDAPILKERPSVPTILPANEVEIVWKMSLDGMILFDRVLNQNKAVIWKPCAEYLKLDFDT